MIENFFLAKSVAVIGASANKQKLGYQLLNNLIKSGYTGKIFPVNLKEKKILGLEVYESVLDIHRQIDLAVIIIPREAVPQVLKQCVLKTIPTVVIISAGFAEKDKPGRELQKDLEKIIKNKKTKIIGPNCLGIINTENRLNLTFAASDVKAGGIGLILQSGAIGAAILDWAKENNLGISKFISLGNKISITEVESLISLGDDPQTKVIAVYLEEISEPAEFLNTCRRISKEKPIVILKGGKTEEGVKAASSHTAALSSSNEFNLALFRQINAIEAYGFEELLNLLEFFSGKNFSVERNLAIVTNAGGAGILAADAAVRDFRLAKVSKKTKKEISENLPNFASLDNPFDLGGDALAKSYDTIIRILEKDDNVAAVLAIVTPQTATEIEKTAEILAKYQKSAKPIVACFMGGYKVKAANKIFLKSHLPQYEDPRLAIELLAKVYRYCQKKDHSSAIVKIEAANRLQNLDEESLAKRYDLPFVETYKVETFGDVMGVVEHLEFPIVFKTAKKIIHKAKHHQVGLNIQDEISLKRAIEKIGFPAMIQPMIETPYEIFIGAKRDANFGIVLIFGAGGIFVEENADISMRILPLTEADLDEMIEEVKIWREIKELISKEPIKKFLIKIGKLMLENQDITSIEINPLKVLKNEIIAVDLKLERKS